MVFGGEGAVGEGKPLGDVFSLGVGVLSLKYIRIPEINKVLLCLLFGA